MRRTTTSPSRTTGALRPGRRQDGHLGRRDDGGEGGHAQHAQVGERERALGDLRGAQLAGACPCHQVSQRRRQVGDRRRSRALEQGRRDEPVIARSMATPMLTASTRSSDVAVPDGVEGRVRGEGQRDGLQEQRRDASRDPRAARPSLSAAQRPSSAASISRSARDIEVGRRLLALRPCAGRSPGASG